jgi:carbamate kinase
VRIVAAAVETGFGTPAAKPILRATPADLRALQLPAGSMGPKVEAVCRFVELTGGTAAIGSLHDTDAILAGTAGTIVTPPDPAGEPKPTSQHGHRPPRRPAHRPRTLRNPGCRVLSVMKAGEPVRRVKTSPRC